MAAGAHRLGAAPGPHFDFDRPAVLAKTSLLIDEAGKVLAVVQQGDQPHESKTSRKRHFGQHFNRPNMLHSMTWRPTALIWISGREAGGVKSAMCRQV